MHVVVDVKPADKQKFVGLGQVAYELKSGDEIYVNDPYDCTSYVAAVQDVIIKLHYGNFGGYGLKIIYFAFGILTCFVIVSGVLIWVEARNKRSTAAWKRKSNEWVASVFMAISLSLYPVTALAFNLVQLFKGSDQSPYHVFIYKLFFLSWLALAIVFSIKRDSYFTAKYNLLLGSILGSIIPFVHGFITGKWFWNTFQVETIQLFVVDVFWMTTSAVALLAFFKMKRKPAVPLPENISNQSEKKMVLKLNGKMRETV